MPTTVNINLYKLRKFRDTLNADLRLSSNGPVRKALDEWGSLISLFLLNRYERFSRGQGNWRQLSPVTIAGKIRRGLLLLILRATDTLYDYLNPTFSKKPGELSEAVPFGVRVGWGKNMERLHPDSKTKTIADIARFHQEGRGRLPQRKIIAPPDQDTINKMRAVMQTAVKQMAKDAGYN